MAWVDQRRGVDFDIFATRVATDGAVLDERGIAVSAGPGSDRWPSAASGAGLFFVTWESTTLSDILAARVDAAGRVLDAPVPLSVAATPETERRPKVAFDGRHFLVVWQVGTDGGHVLGRRFDTAGAPVDSSALPVAVGPWPQGDPFVACHPSKCFVAWTDGRDGGEDVYGAWLDAAGGVSPAEGLALTSLSSSQRAGAVAAVDGGFLVVWEDRRAGNEDLFAARVPLEALPATTHLADLDGFALRDGGIRELRPFVVDAEPHPLMTWNEFHNATGYDVYFSRVDVAAGALLDAPAVLIGTGGGGRWQLSPGLSWNGQRVLASWFDNRSEGFDTYYGRFITPGGAVEPERVVALAANRQLQPRVAASGAGYLVVWSDRRGSIDTAYQVAASIVGVDGEAVGDAGGLVLSAEPPGPLVRDPSAASDGRNWLVVWARQAGSTEDLAYLLLDARGEVVLGAALLVGGAGNQSYPAVAFDGEAFVVAWSDSRSGSWDQHVHRLDRALSPIEDGGSVLAGGVGTQAQGTLACAGGRCLVSWLSAVPDGGQQVVASLWDPRLGTSSSPEVLGDTLASQARPSVAAAPDAGFLVVWRDLSSRHGAAPSTDGGSGLSVYGRRFGAAGEALTPPLRLGGAGGSPGGPVSTFDGNFWLVAWTDTMALPTGGVYAARVSLGGTPLDDGGALLTPGLDTQPSSPSLAAVGGGLSLLAYTRFDGTHPYSSQRTRVRAVATAALELGERCVSPLECASGACVDGRCCASSCGATLDRCLVCSVEAGGTADGTCTPARVEALRACRPAVSECDLDELCLGEAGCPVDLWREDGAPCDGGTCASGVCARSAAGAPGGSVTLRLGCDCGSVDERPGALPSALALLVPIALAATARRRMAAPARRR